MNVRVDRDESPLGSWVLARLEPGVPPWAAEGIWCFEGRLNLLRERHFPSGRLELVVQLRSRFLDATHGEPDPFPARCLSGIQLRPDVIEAPPEHTSVVGIRLHPLGAYALVGQAAGELGDGTVDLDLVLGEASRELGERCHAAPTVVERVRAVAGWVARRVLGGPTPDPAVRWIVSELEGRGGRARIAELRERTGWSATRLTEAFRREVGVTPKVFARILRFRTAMDRLAAGEEDLSRVAHATGYYDQAHFNGEFRSLAGMTPSDYLSGLRFPGARSLAEEAP